MGGRALLEQTMYQVKIDTGANVTVIPASVYKESEHGSLKPSNWSLNGVDQQPLQVIGSFTGSLSHDNMETAENIFVKEGLSLPLVSRPAISTLNLVTRVFLKSSRSKGNS